MTMGIAEIPDVTFPAEPDEPEAATVPESEPVTLISVPAAIPEAVASTSIQLDTTHNYVKNLPLHPARIAGYDTGSESIKWTEHDWSLFPEAKHVHINQDPKSDPLLGNVLDVEGGAWTVDEAVEAAKVRQEHGRTVNLYISEGAIASLKVALNQGGIKKAYLWVANWNLSQQEATNQIETAGDYQVVCIQFASPSSNPTTLVPGSTLTLKEANVDLSVALDSWLSEDTSQPPVVPAKPAILTVTVPVTLTSEDGGKTWK